MKLRLPSSLLVYVATVGVAGLLVLGAWIYTQDSQARIAEVRRSGAELASQEGSEVKPVKVLRVFGHKVEDILTLPGSVEAIHDIQMTARSSGPIDWIGPKEGAEVRRGQELMHLESDLEKAIVGSARADYAEALSNFEREKRLAEASVTPDKKREEYRFALMKAEALLKQASVSLAYRSILSPIDGTVERIPVDVGERVSDGDPVLRIVNTDQVRILVNVPEREIEYFEKGKSVRVSPFQDPSIKIPGIVDFVARVADPGSLTFDVKVIVENSAAKFRPGMLVDVETIRRSSDNALTVPVYAVIEDHHSETILIVEEGVAKKRQVKIEPLQSGLVEIIEGIQENEPVIVVGQRNLAEGERVRIADDLTPLARQLIEGGGTHGNLLMQPSL